MYLRKSNFSRGELIPIAFRLSFTGYCLDLLELEGLRFTGLCISSAFRTSILSSNFVNAETLCISSSSLLSLMSIVRKRASVSLKYSEQFPEETITRKLLVGNNASQTTIVLVSVSYLFLWFHRGSLSACSIILVMNIRISQYSFMQLIVARDLHSYTYIFHLKMFRLLHSSKQR